MIDLCITYIGPGFKYLEHLSRTAIELADNPKDINIRVSFHDGEDRKLLEPIKDRFASITQAKSYRDRKILFWPSANHSSAINALAKECTGDISIFSDYDMVFLKKGWDAELLNLTCDIAGVVYQPFSLSIETGWVKQNLPYLKDATICKYQKVPNLSFLVIKKKVLNEVFHKRLTNFDDFLSKGGVPFRIVNTYKMGLSSNLPPGVIQWMDTGYELPEIILENELSYSLLEHCGISILKQYPRDQMMKLDVPEVFSLHGEPFLAHYKKGFKKTQKDNVYTWEMFVEDTKVPL